MVNENDSTIQHDTYVYHFRADFPDEAPCFDLCDGDRIIETREGDLISLDFDQMQALIPGLDPHVSDIEVTFRVRAR